MKQYKVRDRLHEDLVTHLLLSRGVAKEEHEQFLNPDYDRDQYDPYLLPDMEAAVDRLFAALTNHEHVAVWSDYDCDGIPGGVLLTDFFRTMGLEVTHYIPHRHLEGYGLNNEGINELKNKGVSLIVTVDLGTTEVNEIAHAKSLGVDVIVTDHHLVQADHPLPDAVAVINPKRPDSKYPFDGLCGAGMAWKLVQALLKRDRSIMGEGHEKWFLDLVGIATLSDMVPLVGENRMLAHSGLRVMRRNRRPGLASLLKLLRISPMSLTEDDVTFMVSPRINAASRMDNPHLAARMLSAKTEAEGAELAAQLNRINDERKGLVAATVKEANKRMLENAGLVESPVIVMGSPSWRPGILGLVANTLVEAHGKPVFLWGREGGEELRGSCRGDGLVNVVDLMSAANDVFGHFGGHHASGGFSVREDMVHELLPRLSAAHAQVASAGAREPEVVVDRELSFGELSHAHSALKKLAPFGVGNEKPLFMFQGVTIAGVRTFGKQQNHLGATFEQGGKRVEGVSFFSTPESFRKKVSPGERATLVGHVESDWRGQARIRVVDII